MGSLAARMLLRAVVIVLAALPVCVLVTVRYVRSGIVLRCPNAKRAASDARATGQPDGAADPEFAEVYLYDAPTSAFSSIAMISNQSPVSSTETSHFCSLSARIEHMHRCGVESECVSGGRMIIESDAGVWEVAVRHLGTDQASMIVTRKIPAELVELMSHCVDIATFDTVLTSEAFVHTMLERLYAGDADAGKDLNRAVLQLIYRRCARATSDSHTTLGDVRS